jgi:hypothetical protein
MTEIFSADGSVREDSLPPKITGTGSRGVITADDIARSRMAAGGSARPGNRPPREPERMAYPFGGNGPTFLVDRYSLNPLIDFARQLPGGLPAGNPPTMFAAGDLPLLTASGVDVELLRWVPWYLRHSAAATPNPAHIFHILEDTSEEDALQNKAGTDAWFRYRSEVTRWLTAPPPPDVMTEAEYEEWAIGIGWQPATTGRAS